MDLSIIIEQRKEIAIYFLLILKITCLLLIRTNMQLRGGTEKKRQYSLEPTIVPSAQTTLRPCQFASVTKRVKRQAEVETHQHVNTKRPKPCKNDFSDEWKAERTAHLQTLSLQQQEQTMVHYLHQEIHRLTEANHAAQLESYIARAASSKLNAEKDAILTRALAMFAELEQLMPLGSTLHHAFALKRHHFLREFAPDRAESKEYVPPTPPPSPAILSLSAPSPLLSSHPKRKELASEERDDDNKEQPKAKKSKCGKRGRPSKFAPEVQRHGNFGFFYHNTTATKYEQVKHALAQGDIVGNLYVVANPREVKEIKESTFRMLRLKLQGDHLYDLSYIRKDGVYDFEGAWNISQLTDNDIYGYIKRPPESEEEQRFLEQLVHDAI